jgi:hypothetical protein
MELGKFKEYIESFENNYLFDYSISEPFSWRGSYCEVAFSIENESSTKEDILEKILLAYNNIFRGYKGGEYKYTDNTDIHFEYDYSSYSGEGYAQRLIEDITRKEEPLTIEEKLVRLAFQ